MFGLSGFSWARCGVTICPALLKSLSDGALLAWIAKYFRANWLRRGKSLTWILYHSSGSSFPSMMGNCKYLFISSFFQSITWRLCWWGWLSDLFKSISKHFDSWEDILCLAICRSLMDRDLTCFWKLPQNESSFWIAFVYIKYVITCLLFYISMWKKLKVDTFNRFSLRFFYEYAQMV